MSGVRRQAYAAMLDISEQMVAAARTEDWDGVVALEARSRSLVDALAGAAAAPLGEDERAERMDIIHRVLANDAEVRRLAQPRMARLELLLQGLRRGRRATDAYREPSPG